MIVLGAMLLACGVVAISLVRALRDAKGFMAAASRLELRNASDANVRELATKYRGTQIGNCVSQHCTYLFSFQNVWLRRLRLAPRTWLSATLNVSEGTLVGRAVTFSSGSGLAPFIAQTEEGAYRPHATSQPYEVSFNWSGRARWRVIVKLTPLATTEEKHQAYSFNIGCLARIGGCEDAALLLPGIQWPTNSPDIGR